MHLPLAYLSFFLLLFCSSFSFFFGLYFLCISCPSILYGYDRVTTVACSNTVRRALLQWRAHRWKHAKVVRSKVWKFGIISKVEPGLEVAVAGCKWYHWYRCSTASTIDGREIRWEESITYLGVHITSAKAFACSLANAKKSFYSWL